ncbi:MAG: hypothetical protein ACSHX8_03490 [Opitutaceae bacterium]
MPINERSHLMFEATPLDQQFEVSYHFYESLPSRPFDPEWRTKIKMDVIGTVYDSDKNYSPAAQRIEKGWAILWEDESFGWKSVERLLLEESLREDASDEVKVAKAPKIPVEDWDRPTVPLAGMTGFMFSTPTRP